MANYMRKYKDLSNRRFGRLLAVEYDCTDKDDHAIWRCVCDCGNQVVVRSNSLISRNTSSCGKCVSLKIRKISVVIDRAD